MKKVEAWAYSHTRDLQSNLDVVWKSVIRDTDIPSFKGKIWVSGKAPCQCVDASGNPITTPETGADFWRRQSSASAPTANLTRQDSF